VKRLVYKDHFSHLLQMQDKKLDELKEVANEGFDKAQDDWERSVKMWSECSLSFLTSSCVPRYIYAIPIQRLPDGVSTDSLL